MGRETEAKETGGLTAEEILLMDDATLNQVCAGSRPWRAREAAPADGRLLRGPDPAHQLRDQALPKPAGGEDQIRSLQGASYESVPHTSLCLIRVCAVHQSSLDVPCAPNKLELYARHRHRHRQAAQGIAGDTRSSLHHAR